MRRFAGLVALICAVLAACADDPAEPSQQAPSPPAAQQSDAAAEPEPVAEQQAEQESSTAPAQSSVERSEAASEQDEAVQESETEDEPVSEPEAPRLADVKIDFEEAIRNGPSFRRPTDAFARHDGSIFVAEQEGTITRFNPADGSSKIVLDLPVQVGFEEGLLAIRRGPYAEDPFYIYAWYTPPGGRLSRLSRFHFEDGFTFASDVVTELVILEVEQPYPNHNGGAIRFGPDGMLYLGIGDGGSQGDPLGHGQNPATLFGSVIRIDVRDASAETPYTIPRDNPWASGDSGAPKYGPSAFAIRGGWRSTPMAANSGSATWEGACARRST